MARKDITMSPGEIQAFFQEQMTLQVATNGKDGFPHVAPMWFVVEDEKLVFRSFTKSQKIVNLQRNPNFTVLLEDGLDYAELRGVMIKATATLVTDRDYVLAMYGKLAARYPMLGGQPVELDPESLENAFGRFAEKNTAVVVEPVKVISWDHRKLGGGY
ncbi:MAG: pyridoxamine 5'-phosphate oxidase family protein [Acidimicrobiia bacterium]|nr:pyridoxamine 5'-phosphate oxidase family protein [Acidimicrobiia bacterium]